MKEETRINMSPGQPSPAATRLSGEQERQIMEFVEGIIRRTRLWRGEEYEVRLELLDHFDDGVTSGKSVDQLIQDFGSPRNAALLIRSAKLRNRPLSWHLQHRALQVCAAFGCAFLVVVIFLVARLHLGTLGPPIDVVGKLDSATSQVAGADRGWPDYRAGLMLLDRTPRKVVGNRDLIREALVAGPADPNWDLAVRHLDSNRAALDLFVRGASHPRLGFVYRDTANDAWLSLGKYRSSGESYPRDKPSAQILLTHYQELGYVRNLLYEAGLRAFHNRDQAEFHRLWQAQSKMATQIMIEGDFIVSQAIGRASAANATALLRRLVMEHSDVVSNAQLQAYRQELTAADWEWRSTTFDQFRLYSDAFLDAVYSRDTAGNGQVTAAGCATLKEDFLASNSPRNQLVWTALLPEIRAAGLPYQPGAPARRPVPKLDAVNQELLALRWSLTLADRRDMRAKMDSLLDLLRLELDKPLTQRQAFAESPYGMELQRLATTPSQLRRYWPILTVLPSQDRVDWVETAQTRMTMTREATLTVIALEQYRRRTGDWPARLEQLVPGDLPHIPQDAFSGRSLVYRLVKGMPLLYSVWDDRDDDGGSPIPQETTTAGPHNGDFRFVPTQ